MAGPAKKTSKTSTKPISFTYRGGEPKTTSIGHSSLTRFRSKNDRRNKKPYRGQGR